MRLAKGVARIHARTAWVALLAVAPLFACSSPSSKLDADPAHEPRADPLAAFEGSWIHRAPRSIIGRGTDEVWTIQRTDAGWTLAVTTVHYPSVNEPSRAVLRGTYAPVPLAWTDGGFEFVHPQRPAFVERLTAERVGDVMRAPALVRRDERTWEYRSWRESERFQCEHDPRVVTSGRATLTRPGHADRAMHYRSATAPSSSSLSAPVPCLEFFELDADGREDIQVRILFEAEPWGTIERRGAGWDGFAGRQWELLDAHEWAEIRALPHTSSAAWLDVTRY